MDVVQIAVAVIVVVDDLVITRVVAVVVAILCLGVVISGVVKISCLSLGREVGSMDISLLSLDAFCSDASLSSLLAFAPNPGPKEPK